MKFENYLYDECKKIIEGWETEPETYAISFFLYANEDYVYKNNCCFPEFSVGYNTESDCSLASAYDEERWNFAFWRQDNTIVISSETEEAAELLLEWYHQNGIEQTGPENEDEMYDDDMEYIGKGPVGYYELLMLIANVAKRLQEDGTVKNKYGNIPIIVHDLEYPWFIKEATVIANPHNEAENFLKFYEETFE